MGAKEHGRAPRAKVFFRILAFSFFAFLRYGDLRASYIDLPPVGLAFSRLPPRALRAQEHTQKTKRDGSSNSPASPADSRLS